MLTHTRTNVPQVQQRLYMRDERSRYLAQHLLSRLSFALLMLLSRGQNYLGQFPGNVGGLNCNFIAKV